MPMDFNYTTDQKDRDNVYHVLYRCPDAKDIQDENHEYRKPPKDENRRPCLTCLTCLNEISKWLGVASKEIKQFGV